MTPLGLIKRMLLLIEEAYERPGQPFHVGQHLDDTAVPGNHPGQIRSNDDAPTPKIVKEL